MEMENIHKIGNYVSEVAKYSFDPQLLVHVLVSQPQRLASWGDIQLVGVSKIGLIIVVNTQKTNYVVFTMNSKSTVDVHLMNENIEVFKTLHDVDPHDISETADRYIKFLSIISN